jgi:hypothetical protein
MVLLVLHQAVQVGAVEVMLEQALQVHLVKAMQVVQVQALQIMVAVVVVELLL